MAEVPEPATGENAPELIRTDAFADRVSVSVPAGWVTRREVDLAFRPKSGGQVSMLLFDRQYHATRHETYQRTVERLETMQAVQQSSQWCLTFDPATQRVLVHGLRVCRQDAEVEHAQSGRFRLLQREENLERLVLDGSVTLMVLLDDVRVGDVLDISYTIQTAPRLFRDQFSLFASVPEQMNLREYHLSIRFPTGTAMQWQSSSAGFAPQAREWAEETEWFWTMENVVPSALEPDVPSRLLPTHWLQVTDGQTWSGIAAELAAAWQEDANDAEIFRTVDVITSATGDPIERAERAIALVQDEIRYLSVNIELGGHTPSPPGIVLRRRFGDCKDKSFLLAHLLKRFGIAARPVLVSTILQRTVERLLPTPAAFDHCIVEYELGGVRRWVDVTVPLQGGGALGRQLPDYETGLPVGPDTAGLEPAPKASQRDDKYILRETYRPDTSGGTSVLEVIVTTSGRCADGFRASFANEGPDEVAKDREEIYRRSYPGLKRIGTIQWRDDRPANEFVMGDSFEIPNMLSPWSEPSHVALECRAHLIESVLAMPAVAGRKSPLKFSIPRRVEHWIDVDFPNMMHGEIEPIAFRDDAFHFWRENRRTATLFVLLSLADEISPAKLLTHHATVTNVYARTSLTFLLPIGFPVSRRGRRQAVLPPPGKASGSARTASGGKLPRQAAAGGFSARRGTTAAEDASDISDRPKREFRMAEPAEESSRARERRLRSERTRIILIVLTTIAGLALAVWLYGFLSV